MDRTLAGLWRRPPRTGGTGGWDKLRTHDASDSLMYRGPLFGDAALDFSDLQIFFAPMKYFLAGGVWVADCKFARQLEL